MTAAHTSWIFLVKSVFSYRQFREAQPNQEVCSPVGAPRHGHGSWSRSLGEEFGHDKPRNGTRTHLKTGNEAKHGDYGQVAERWRGLLLRENKQNEEKSDGCTFKSSSRTVR